MTNSKNSPRYRIRNSILFKDITFLKNCSSLLSAKFFHLQRYRLVIGFLHLNLFSLLSTDKVTGHDMSILVEQTLPKMPKSRIKKSTFPI